MHWRTLASEVIVHFLMQNTGIVFTILALCVASFSAEQADKNDQWCKNNLMLKNFDTFYLMLPATTSEAEIRSKRFASVLSSALVYYAASNALLELDRVREAVNKTKADLELPADALAGPMRAYFTLLRDVIGQPINDVKVSCSPNTTQADCTAALKKYHKMNRDKCSDYDKNLELYEKARHFFAGKEFERFLSTVKEVSENDDKIALAFFVDMVFVDFSDLVREGRSLYRMRASNTYRCNVRNLALF